MLCPAPFPSQLIYSLFNLAFISPSQMPSQLSSHLFHFFQPFGGLPRAPKRYVTYQYRFVNQYSQPFYGSRHFCFSTRTQKNKAELACDSKRCYKTDATFAYDTQNIYTKCCKTVQTVKARSHSNWSNLRRRYLSRI